MQRRRTAIVVLVGGLCVLLALAFVFQTPISLLLQTGSTPEAKSAAIRDWLHRWGPGAPLLYVLFVTVEVVVAPVPGLFLYAPGGAYFGGVPGGALALAGNTLGAGLACWLMRRFGYNKLRGLLTENGQALQQRLGSHGFWFVLLLRLNPLTSSDMVSYAAGLTPMPVWQVMLATCIGMAPLCFAQSVLAASVFDLFPGLLVPLLAACLVNMLVVAAVIVRIPFRQAPEDGGG